MDSFNTIKKFFVSFKEFLTHVSQAHSFLEQGEVVGIPTETVYGLAAYGYQEKAIQKIYTLKKRPTSNPLILHYPCMDAVTQDVLWTNDARILAKTFWPGPLTLILPKGPHCQVPDVASAQLPSLAVRVPSHPLLQSLLRLCTQPLAAPSANISGYLSPTTAQHVRDFFSIPILDGGPCFYGLESTIIDCRHAPCLLRPGAISLKAIESVLQYPLSQTSLHQSFPSPQDLCAPGLLKGHYAPSKPLRLHATYVDPDEGVLAFGPHSFTSPFIVQLSLEKNLDEAAHKFFFSLRDLDQGPCARIAVMPIPYEGIGWAINERLYRATLST